ncbi:hypothetical protein V1514DRAFT_364818 [Lipomyces japonicus]|uniref:uncharacterized protein n=1 Tax=Lipomyces japonicus TaxID=56871 RepID=UPI0034CDFC41
MLFTAVLFLTYCSVLAAAFPISLGFLFRGSHDDVAIVQEPVTLKFHKRLLNGTITSSNDLYPTAVASSTQQSSTVTATLYTTAVEVEDVTSTITQLVTLYVTRTLSSDGVAPSEYVSPSVQTLSQTITFSKTVAAYLGTSSPIATSTIKATHVGSDASTVSYTSAPVVATTPSLSSDLPAGTYESVSTVTIPVTETFTKTVEYTAKVTDDNSSTRYLTLTKTLTLTETAAVVQPTVVGFVVDAKKETKTGSVVTTTTVTGANGHVTSVLTEVPTTYTDLVTSTSTLTQYVTIFLTSIIHRPTSTFLSRPYLNTTLTTKTAQYTPLLTLTKAPVSTPSYTGTTTIYEYVTVSASEQNSTSIPIVSTSSASTNSNSTLHFSQHTTRSRRAGFLRKLFE